MKEHDIHLFYHLLESKSLSPTLHNFFESCVNTNKNEKQQTEQFKRLMSQIANMVETKGIWYTVGALQAMHVNTFWKVIKEVNVEDPSRYYWSMEPIVR